MTTSSNPASTESVNPASLIDLERYPLDRPESDEYREMIAQARKNLADIGAVSLPGFLSATGLEIFQAEFNNLLPVARCRESQESPYGTVPEVDVPDNHPYRFTSLQKRHHVARHQMPKGAIDALYRWPPLRKFVGDLMGKDELFLHEDPSNAIVLLVYKEGENMAWHFDSTDYSMLITLQGAEAGGVFEYVPALRSAEDECFDDVMSVLDGDRARVLERRSKAGVFTMINGKNALHRVTPVEGATPRVQMAFCYEDEPGRKLDVETRRHYYGADAPGDAPGDAPEVGASA